MVQQLLWSKEVTYDFNYNGENYKEHIYVNGIDGIRYRLYNDDFSQPISLTTHLSTNSGHQVIEAVLVAERIINQTSDKLKVELLYLLPDINKHLRIDFQKYLTSEKWDESLQEVVYGEFWVTEWGLGGITY